MQSVRRPRDPLLMFLYILLRDLLPSGEVEEVMVNHVDVKVEGELPDLIDFSNPFLVAHAEDLIARLRPSLQGTVVCGLVSAESYWPCAREPGHPGSHENAAKGWPRRPDDHCPPEILST